MIRRHLVLRSRAGIDNLTYLSFQVHYDYKAYSANPVASKHKIAT